MCHYFMFYANRQFSDGHIKVTCWTKLNIPCLWCADEDTSKLRAELRTVVGLLDPDKDPEFLQRVVANLDTHLKTVASTVLNP